MAANDPHLGSLNAAYIEALYRDYRRDPASVPPDWRGVFAALDGGPALPAAPSPSGPAAGDTGAPAPAPPAPTAEVTGASAPDPFLARVERLTEGYRSYGHFAARLDPLGSVRPRPPELDPAFHGLSEHDFQRPVAAAPAPMTLAGWIQRLETIYCGSIGIEYVHVPDGRIRRWFRERLEGPEAAAPLSPHEQRDLLARLTDAAVFEAFLQDRYPGAKTFSLEGAETLIPILADAVEWSADAGVVEIVLGMAHRGRLNVLVNILGMSPRRVFEEFEDGDPHRFAGRGDVAYHLGYSGDWTSRRGRSVHLTLCFNPSHLEFINPVAMGRLRAKQDRAGSGDRGEKSLLLLIHGDAAFAGEGIVPETLNLSGLEAYRVGGALHIVINNQIGFVTPPSQGRSSHYATDAAKMLPVPILHVNGDDPEAALRAVRLALDFRRKFRRDVVVDLYGYRRRGHNEADEPTYTQPLLYAAIEGRRPIRDLYRDALATRGTVSRDEADAFWKGRLARLEEGLTAARTPGGRRQGPPPTGVWQGYHGGPESGAVEAPTGVEEARLRELLERITRAPEGFRVHPKLARILASRRAMAQGRRPVDWAAAEALAFVSLAAEGHRVRLSGLVLLLPHGFEGQGPEHSSARPERFLALAAEENLQVVYPTTPAQYFHCLRRQVLRRWRKPLIVFTPKSLLRHPLATSRLDELARGAFRRVIPDPRFQRADSAAGSNPEGEERARRQAARGVKRLLLCWGKVYYDLMERRRERGLEDQVAIVRLEQAYPFPEGPLRDALACYDPDLPVVWVQEEPANMGAWGFLRRMAGERLFGRPLWRVSRPEAASPATGSARVHRLEQEKLLDMAFSEKGEVGPWWSM